MLVACQVQAQSTTLQAAKMGIMQHASGQLMIGAKGNITLISPTYALTCDQLQGFIDETLPGDFLDKLTTLTVQGNLIIVTSDRELTTTRAQLDAKTGLIFFPDKVFIKDLSRNLSTTAKNATFNIKTKSFQLAGAKTQLQTFIPLSELTK